MRRYSLFCLPFAGASIFSYRRYVAESPANINAIPVEIPGRGSRFREEPLKDLDSIAEDIFRQLESRLHQPYALYGHSMGGLLVHLLTRKIMAKGLEKPSCIFISGCRGPSFRRAASRYYLLPKQEFITKLREFGGAADEILNDEKVMEFYEPVLRSDFQACDSFVYKEGELLDIPVIVFYGTEDRVTHEEAAAWQKETRCGVEIFDLPGA